jgi:flagellar basal body-associated protein FliL
MASPKSPAAAAGPRLRLSRIAEMLRRQPLFSACVAVVLLGGIGTGAILLLGGRPEGVTVDLGGPLTYQPLPEIIADLKPSAKRSHHIKLVIVAQLPAQQAAGLTAKEVEVVAAVQARLRELSVQDVAGATGADRLRAIVLAAVNATIAPAQARTVLFTQMLVD